MAKTEKNPEPSPVDQPLYTDAQLRMIAEIQRVAKELGVDRLSQREFDENHSFGSVTTAGYQFGSWNEAVRAAGLDPYQSGYSNAGPKISDEELLLDVMHCARLLGKPPSERQYTAKGKYSCKPFRDRWGSFSKARDVAYERYGDAGSS